MTTRTTLPARNSDPGTSHEAAAKAVRTRPRVRDAILDVLRVQGPMTHDDLMVHVTASPSGVRTRTSELVTDGLVEPVPDEAGRSDLGNTARLWRATNV